MTQLNHSSLFDRSKTLATAGLALLCLSESLFAQTPARVDLRSKQTPFKNQGGRRTCTTFCSVAALEACYKRAGYGNIDLSEEFLNYMTKMFWLSNTTPSNAALRDNQASWSAGGSGPDLLGMLTSTPIPIESLMRYKPAGHSAPNKTNKAFWKIQKNVNDWGLDQRNLPRKALTASRYYGVRAFSRTTANNTSSIEAILALGKEVVWGFKPDGLIKTHRNYSASGQTTSPAIWVPSTRKSTDGHCMLIVGYDRKKSYFICKNHWGATGRSADGFTYISYSYLRKYGTTANYITAIKSPTLRYEMAFIGRYNLAFDGHRGTLDITHLPGAMQWRFNRDGVRETDRRIGTFFDSKGVAHRVNGSVRGKQIIFWFKRARKVMTFGELRDSTTAGQRFVYYMSNPARGEMAGYHHDNPGVLPNPAWGGYARTPTAILATNGFLSPSFNSSEPTRPEMHYGLYNCQFNGITGQISVQYRNDSLVSSSLRATWAGLQCEFIDTRTSARRRVPFVALVRKSRPAEIFYRFTHPSRGYVSARCYMLSWQRGVTAGDVNNGSVNGMFAWRIGAAVQAGYSTKRGTGCRGSNGILNHIVSPAPFLGRRSTVWTTGGPKRGNGIWALGTYSAPTLFPGTKSCFLRLNPAVTTPISYSASGLFRLSMAVPNDRTLFGTSIYSQFAGFDSGAAGGLTLSNAIFLRVGGYR